MRVRLILLSLAFALGGCATLDELFGSPEYRPPPAKPLEDRKVSEPIASNRFVLESAAQSVVGRPQLVYARAEDTLSDFAREYGLGYDEVVDANPGVDPWLPGEGTPVILPTQFVLPDGPRSGLVLNIASKRIFYYPAVGAGEPAVVLTYPVGIGRVGWETPTGSTTVVAKATDPHWYPPWSVRQEHAEMGDPLPAIVEPGPDNPLGRHVLKLDLPGYLIHGTNMPYGVGMRVSHGCVRLYPEDIEALFALVDIGESVRIVNEPFLLGRQDGALYFESHAPLEDDPVEAEARLLALIERHEQGSGTKLTAAEKHHVRALATRIHGVPVRVDAFDADEMYARALLVRNTVVADPDAPTLAEVREMIEAAVAEGEAQ